MIERAQTREQLEEEAEVLAEKLGKEPPTFNRFTDAALKAHVQHMRAEAARKEAADPSQDPPTPPTQDPAKDPETPTEDSPKDPETADAAVQPVVYVCGPRSLVARPRCVAPGDVVTARSFPPGVFDRLVASGGVVRKS